MNIQILISSLIKLIGFKLVLGKTNPPMFPISESALFESRIQKCCKPDEVLTSNGHGCSQYMGIQDLVSYPFDTTIEQLDKIPTKFHINSRSGPPTCSKNEEQTMLLHSEDSVAFLIDRSTENSVLFHVESATFHEKFCVERMVNEEQDILGIAAILCQKLPTYECRVRPCVRKCCHFGQTYNYENDQCQETDGPRVGKKMAQSWEPTLMDNKKEPISGPSHDIKYFFGNPTCHPNDLHIYDSRSEDFHFYETGELVLKGERHNYSRYCVINVTDLDNPDRQTFESVKVCMSTRLRFIASEVELVVMDILPILFVISLVFLAITFILVFKRRRDKLFGIMTLCMISMLFLLYSFLVIPHFTGPSHITEYPIACQIEGIAIQFCYLSALFWLNCMCFMIWKNFRRIRRSTENEPKGIRNPMFYKYALWAWGGPAVISVTTLFIHLLPDWVGTYIIKPDLGVTRCFLGDQGMFLYFHIVTAPCLIFNLLGFICTSWNLCYGVWSQRQGDPLVRAQQQYRMLTVTKMFFALGISWLSEVISWTLLTLFGRDLWVITTSFLFDVINALQGVILFVVLFFDAGTVSRMRTSIRRTLSATDEPILQANYRVRQGSKVSLTNVTTETRIQGPMEAKNGTRESVKTIVSTLSYPLRKSYTYEVTTVTTTVAKVELEHE
ncbi:hypothetical protein TCAL_02020 [Tigriopus californicus]|uniref:G-protein coupled receptors family 2 profile 2 domain-containing protein n=1 Tax=Tigriopus californicus TaxID=6832 RepID=A0A553PFK5_TIGCA|nr:G-protein coupled receptor Mth2-like [Tigriopus californicus]TRY76456.1 hypothetical protein TCAL_02020 [Tigriopus californicus]|eukprot:TCALIF_02020-PA protein Name:"Similar to mthl1 Probable G-protein coupled receptor Mth-like 1 (Drosophila melanogaster)" AED:0.14 eAED:0.17 QI:0/-1/0/1/-1/1/1/0/669